MSDTQTEAAAGGGRADTAGTDTAGTSPAGTDPAGTDAAGPGAGRALSPSRAGDFLACPLLYRFRVIDRLPEPPSPAAARGTLVHAVLEHLFDRPAAGRTPEAARSLLGPEWDHLAAREPELAGLFESDAERVTWLDEAAAMLDSYFRLEDPRRGSSHFSKRGWIAFGFS